jgi:5-methyltetrahydrofolate--homocysteine methyltransferase
VAALRDRRLDGFKFRRQHPVGQFVVDFCCLERRLAIEVDGEIHDRQRERDAERDANLAAAGLRVLRIPNTTMQSEFHRVLATIRAALREPLAEPPNAMDHSPDL